MAPLLLAFGSCHEAFEAAPAVRALRAAGRAVTVACFCSASTVDDARALGLDGPVALREPANGASPAQRAAAAAGFAAELLQQRPAAVLTIGSGELAVAVGVAAMREGIPVVRLGAGVRSSGHDARDAQRRLADHAATAWFVATSWQKHELAREGLPPSRIQVTGSLLADAIAGWPAAEEELSTVFVAIEHGTPVDDPEVAAAARLPLERAQRLSAREQVERALAARLIVTDSVGWQQFAAAAAIPCIVLGPGGAFPDTIGLGSCTHCAPTPGALADAVARQRKLLLPQRPSSAGAAGKVVAEIAVLMAAALPKATPQPAPTLPSDGDASGRTFGDDEIALVTAVLRSGTLNSTKGTFVTTFEKRFAQWLGRKHAIACASGSAAMHCAIAALQLKPGDEVITTPITDMGALTPILYEGAVPVFADVEPVSLNVTADTIRAQLTDRTRAIVVTHLFGLPCDLAPIRALAEQRGIPIIEDGAQAFGATIDHRKVGTFGALAAFSLQQGKHITSGEGGIVATDDDALARRVFLYVNKAWGYGDPKPDHYFPALNYRLTELQGAVLVAQLPKLDDVIARRREVADALREALAGVRGLTLPDDPEHGTHSYWKFAFHVDAAAIPGGARALGKRMQAAGVSCVPNYIQKPAFDCALFADWRASPVTWLPLQHNPRRERATAMFARADYPGAVRALDTVIVLPINERYTQQHVDFVASTIRAAVQELARG